MKQIGAVLLLVDLVGKNKSRTKGDGTYNSDGLLGLLLFLLLLFTVAGTTRGVRILRGRRVSVVSAQRNRLILKLRFKTKTRFLIIIKLLIDTVW